MSLQFQQITNLIDRTCKSNSTTYPIADKVADINLGMDKVFDIIFKASGKWQFDDSNNVDADGNPDYPIITTNLLQGQRDYAFTTDNGGHLILDIYKVMVKNPTNGYYYDIYPIDQQTDPNTLGFTDGRNLQALPNRYDKTSNGIFLDPIPAYDAEDGLKVFINREGTYFNVSDVTKMPGFAGLFHSYLAWYASYLYASRNSLPVAGGRLRNGAYTGLLNQLDEMESAIRKYYRDRTKDEIPVIISERINSI